MVSEYWRNFSDEETHTIEGIRDQAVAALLIARKASEMHPDVACLASFVGLLELQLARLAEIESIAFDDRSAMLTSFEALTLHRTLTALTDSIELYQSAFRKMGEGCSEESETTSPVAKTK